MASGMTKPMQYQRSPSRAEQQNAAFPAPSVPASSTAAGYSNGSAARMTGMRPLGTTIAPVSPSNNNIGRNAAAAEGSRTARKPGHNRPNSIGGSGSTTDGFGNVNRWSISSKSSAGNPHGRNGSFASKRLSVSETFGASLGNSFGDLHFASSSGGGGGSGGDSSNSGSNNTADRNRVNIASANSTAVGSSSSSKKTSKAPTGLAEISAAAAAATAVASTPLQSPPTSPPSKASVKQIKAPRSRITPSISLATLSKAVEAAPLPTSGELTDPKTADILSSATYAPGDGDYFGNAWNNPSPQKQRTRGSPAVSPSVGPSQRDGRITPGGKNSFIASRGVEQPLAKSISRSEPKSHHREASSKSRHSRHRDRTELGSGETEDSSTSSVYSPGERKRRKVPSQKAMLSKALQKANQAVLLDNASNFEGAIEAYRDACDLLQQVMLRSAGVDDRRKLENIRTTYRNRIDELKDTELLQQAANDKALPEVPKPRPDSSTTTEPFSPITSDSDLEIPVIETAVAARLNGDMGSRVSQVVNTAAISRDQIPPRRQSLMLRNDLISAQVESQATPPIVLDNVIEEEQDLDEENDFQAIANDTTSLAAPMNRDYMPPPLSPRRGVSPSGESDQRTPTNSTTPNQTPAIENPPSGHARQVTIETTSWLDTIDESAGDSDSSVHSRTSSYGVRRKHIRTGSGDTEAEFDAALDAAVEAAYDDGFEPASEDEENDPIAVLTTAQTEPTTTRNKTLADVKRSVDIARQRVREAEREAAIAAAKNAEKRRLMDLGNDVGRQRSESVNLEYGDDEAEEEERLLEEMTRDYILDDGDYENRAKSGVPRQSDHSTFSGRTWASSTGSIPTTAGTSLSTSLTAVAELGFLTSASPPKVPSLSSPPAMPPPTSALPPPPMPPNAAPPPPLFKSAPSTSQTLSVTSPGVRERRLSGQKIKQLKIDTTAKPSFLPPKTQPPTKLPPVIPPAQLSEPPKSASFPSQSVQEPVSNTSLKPPVLLTAPRNVSSPLPASSPSEALGISPLTPASTKSAPAIDSQIPPIPTSPARQNRGLNLSLRKNYSSSSLKSLKGTALPTPPLPTASNNLVDDSPNTPLTRVFSGTTLGASTIRPSTAHHPMPELPTPTAANFVKTSNTTSGLPPGTLSFFDSNIHAQTLRSASASASNANNSRAHSSSASTAVTSSQSAYLPLPLEPCPESVLLRPYWLLRCVFQTISHPRGGYLSTRLFIPRDIWRVRNVKLKAVEEKIAQLDLLTAALLKLARVDSTDADKVLDSMQEFELVLDSVQAVLSKKLGNDVGPQGVGSGVGAFWKGGSSNTGGADGAEAGDMPTLINKNGVSGASSKSLSSTWRKLRAKGGGSAAAASAAAMGGVGQAGSSYNGGSGLGGTGSRGSDGTGWKSLPMTNLANPRFAKRDPSKVLGIGPHSLYMAALARLCDACQVLDQIARQVEDPGLRLSSQTHVGLELSTRHASDTFGFWICRFVLCDIGMMVDKFVKRASEWVIA